jgi:hypothetical protein
MGNHGPSVSCCGILTSLFGITEMNERMTAISSWYEWFAWYPVTVEGKRAWLEKVYRRDCARHTPAGSRYWTEYTTLFGILK